MSRFLHVIERLSSQYPCCHVPLWLSLRKKGLRSQRTRRDVGVSPPSLRETLVRDRLEKVNYNEPEGV